ncbi:MAG TPA: tetratricopeptide repeat protein [Chryseolinea sp.]|nr:tetratricopeptide repeat protein [Chryseolinea sp.]
MMRYFIGILITCTISCKLFAQQDKVDEFRVQQEQLKKTALLRELDSGVYFMDLGNYGRADEKFQYVLDNVRSVPSDLTFYFGKNSFHLGRYKQSIDWLNKYIQLKGTNGQYSNEAVTWMRKAEAEFVKEKSVALNQTGEILSASYDIDCGPAGKVTCPVCKGDHVIVKKGAFGPAYKTCEYCNEQGWLTCEEYNRLLRGELQPKH